MDFLDPRWRRQRNIRLMVGYFLMSIVIGLGTIILVYGAYGYGINTKTGQIIQNGLLFADSQPGGAEVYLNGQDQHLATPARLVLQAGSYTLTLKRSGYHDWQRSFYLNEQSIIRFTYPFLFPTKPVTTGLKTYSSMPPLETQSPDRRWLLVEVPQAAGGPPAFDEYDTNDLTKAPVSLAVPASVLSDGGQSSQLSLVEWSTDNKNVLLKHSYNGRDEYIVFNRAQPTSSFNVNKLFSVDPTQVAFFNKKPDQLYIYDQSAGSLRLGDVSKGTLGAPILTQVLAFKSYGTNLLSYVTDKGAAAGAVQARIWDNGQTYPLYTFSSGTHYLLDIAQFNGHWYYVAGSDTASRINVYKDPLSSISDPAIGRAIPLLALNESGATKVSFSNSAQFVEADNGRTVCVYDAQNQRSYSYSLPSALSAAPRWMDSSRLLFVSSGQAVAEDYDSTNQVQIAPTLEPDGGFFSRGYNHLLTFQSDPAGVKLVNIDMRAGSDLPAQPARLTGG